MPNHNKVQKTNVKLIYYNEVSDTNFESVSCIEGIMNEEHKIMKIQLSNNRTISVKIDYDKGTHYIISNKSTN